MKKSLAVRKLSSLLMFFGVSALAGLLVAGLAVPGAALLSATAIGVSSSLSDLPLELESPPQAERTIVYLANGEKLAEFYDQNRIIVALDQIPEVMQKALLAIEDDRFYEHGALDFKALMNAAISQLPGGNSGRGGSTLTQQYVKQVLINKALAEGDSEGVKEAQAPTLERKIREMRYAIGIEKKLSKDTILEYYLNIVYLGDGAYGVESAARHYYNKSAMDLTLGEAAMLAGIVQTPNRNPVNAPQSSTARRDVVLARMLELGIITQEEMDVAKQEVFDQANVQSMTNGCQGTRYPFICQYIEKTLYLEPSLGDTRIERRDAVFRGGYTVYSVIDPAAQDAAQQAVSSMIAPTDPAIGLVVNVQPGTGFIKAMAQSRPVMGPNQAAGETGYNYIVEASMGGAEGFQPGSMIKPFTAAAALEMGIPPTKVYDSPYTLDMSGKVYRTCTDTVIPRGWKVKNLSPSGIVDMYKATASSINTYYVQLEQQTGICGPVTMATAAGLKVSDPSLDPRHPDIMSYDRTPTFTLGVPYVSMLSLANAYATMAASGVRCDPVIYSSIKDKAGNEIPLKGANCVQAIDPDVANGFNALTQGVFTIGSATGSRLPDGRPAAGKSGTTDDMMTIGFIGYTPEVVSLAVIAKDTNSYYADYWKRYPLNLYGHRLPSGTYLAGTGSSTVAPRLWRPAMIAAVQDLPKTAFTRPSSKILSGKKTEAPSTEGMSVEDARKTLELAGFTVIDNQIFSDDVPAGEYMNATCDGYVGGTCMLNFSKGPRPA